MEEALIKRVMPHSVEAEQSVVGAMLMDKDAITTASEIISGQDFYQTSYGVVFDPWWNFLTKESRSIWSHFRNV